MKLLREGQKLQGAYEVERFLGEGAFAQVFRVRHRFLGRQAMKIFKTIGMTVDETEQTLGEAILLSRIGHPNIIRVFDANILETSKGPRGYFTMEYVAGGSLEQFWRSHGVKLVPIETTVEILRQVCRGLTIAHSEDPPIIHRDIKPQNILVGYDASGLRARVADFGLAKRVNPLTLLASAKGTRSFKAPEAFDVDQRDSCSGDVWSLGSTLYLLLTDRLPFGEPDEFDIMNIGRFDQKMIPASRLSVQVDPHLDRILFKTLAINPDDRYCNAGELLKDLEKWKPRPINKRGMGHQDFGETSKLALGLEHSPADEKTAKEMVSRAIMLSKQVGKVSEAADIMEEAMNKWSALREKYEYQLKLWRRGIAM